LFDQFLLQFGQCQKYKPVGLRVRCSSRTESSYT